MAARKRKRLVWLALLFAGGTGLAYVAGFNFPGRSALPPAPLPPSVVTEIVERLVPIDVPNPVNSTLRLERDAARRESRHYAGRVAELTEQLRLVSEVEVMTEPEIREVVRVVEAAADLGNLLGRVRLDADRYEGLDPSGVYSYGWRGWAHCEIRADPFDDWLEIVTQPLSLEASRSLAVEGPQAPALTPWRAVLRLGVTTAPGLDVSLSWHRTRRLGWYAGLQYDLDPTVFTREVSGYGEARGFAPTIETLAEGAWRLYGGAAFTIGRR